ncbi:MAG: DUF1822 family protein [Cyanobacteria bacterium P01_A01_bin.40]
MDFDTALDYVNSVLRDKTGKELTKPEITIFKGSWQGMTYEQMANSSSYSTNYLMRDIAPKLWKTLSAVFQENIGKTNFRLKLCNLYELSPEEIHQKIIKPSTVRNPSRFDWGDFLSTPLFYVDRRAELETLQQWIVEEKCQLLNIWGLSGSGKTLLMQSLGKLIQQEYEVVIWKNLALAPTLTELIDDLLKSFNIHEKNQIKLLPNLMAMIRSHRCLIMLDGMEAILQPHTLTGKYLPGYEDYATFWRTMEESSHQSCIVTTSLENYRVASKSHNASIRNWKLSGLSQQEAKTLLTADNLNIDESGENLIAYYQGNPAFLIFVGQIIRELFNSNIQEFLATNSLMFSEIERLLNKSFSRLSVLETEILYWFAGESRPMSLLEIQKVITLSIYPVELIEALKSLVQRALIETNQIEQCSVFVLSPIIREFVTNQFIAQIGDNFSLDNRINSSLTSNTINLGNATSELTHLSQWLQNSFEPGWQPVETLFVASERSPARLRSAFNLRGEGVVKRFKQINFENASSSAVLLLVAVSQDESAFKICVQAQPTFSQQTLPVNLQLKLIDSSDAILASIQAQDQDNYIQLPYFRGVLQERFKLRLGLDQANYEEEFVI